MNFNDRPFTVVWETTRACDLACIHCRADALTQRNPLELTTEEAYKLVHMIKSFDQSFTPVKSSFQPDLGAAPRQNVTSARSLPKEEALVGSERKIPPYPFFILTGGDPIKRSDIYDIIAYATKQGLRVAMTPSATPLIKQSVVKRLAEVGLTRLALSLDGSTAEVHDGFRGVSGSFAQTLRILEWCREYEIETQIHTTVTRHSMDDLPHIADSIKAWGIKLWALFFLITIGRAARPEIRKLNIRANDFERVFNWLYDLSKSAPYDITPREGYHYRRVLLQRRAQEMGIPVKMLLEQTSQRPTTPTELVSPASHPKIPRAPLGVNDGKGVVFVSHTGDVQPSGFLPLVGGNILEKPLVEIYRHASLFTQIRDYAQLKGKCGLCEFKNICGGSRARAYALTGDYMQSDPYCVYRPQK